MPATTNTSVAPIGGGDFADVFQLAEDGDLAQACAAGEFFGGQQAAHPIGQDENAIESDGPEFRWRDRCPPAAPSGSPCCRASAGRLRETSASLPARPPACRPVSMPSRMSTRRGIGSAEEEVHRGQGEQRDGRRAEQAPSDRQRSRSATSRGIVPSRQKTSSCRPTTQPSVDQNTRMYRAGIGEIEPQQIGQPIGRREDRPRASPPAAKRAGSRNCSADATELLPISRPKSTSPPRPRSALPATASEPLSERSSAVGIPSFAWRHGCRPTICVATRRTRRIERALSLSSPA